MTVGLRLDLKQSQQLVMTPQLQQAINLLQMSNLELAGFVESEVERNPLLRLETGQRAEAPAPDEARETIPGSAVDQRVTPDGDLTLAAETFDTGTDNLYDTARADVPTLRARPLAGTSSGDTGYEPDLAPAPPLTLRAHLLAQLGQASAAPSVLMLARLMVEELDEHGLLRTPPEEIAQRLGATEALMVEALALLQSCEPTGAGARDLAECLALQLAERDRLDPAMQALIDNLDLLERGQRRRLRTLCGVDEEDFADMLAELRRLDPRPCARFTAEPAETLVPDIFLSRAADGDWQVELNTQTLPRVLIDNRYAARIGTTHEAQAKSFIQGCQADANWLIRSMDQRARTILAVARQIARHQACFFDEGVQGLRPLTLAMVAEATALHESTVSRVTANKYAACPRGIFELKFFFTNAVGEDGTTAEAIRQQIRQMIDREPPMAILSDDEIVQRLQSDGVEVARRTVAKYRKALGIGSSVERRRMKALVSEA
ncbi:MAG: RNA polymerase factor sigma-54 [Paracoccaceae bacterium]|nr:RNA polymerase factor sigma-54 [Paracoccaceae bacterium]